MVIFNLLIIFWLQMLKFSKNGELKKHWASLNISSETLVNKGFCVKKMGSAIILSNINLIMVVRFVNLSLCNK